jgi:hypothetical protein
LLISASIIKTLAPVEPLAIARDHPELRHGAPDLRRDFLDLLDQAMQARRFLLVLDELGIPKSGHRRSPSPDHLRPHRRALQLRGELLILPMHSISSNSFGSVSASIAVERRRLDTPPATFR